MDADSPGDVGPRGRGDLARGARSAAVALVTSFVVTLTLAVAGCDGVELEDAGQDAASGPADASMMDGGDRGLDAGGGRSSDGGLPDSGESGRADGGSPDAGGGDGGVVDAAGFDGGVADGGVADAEPEDGGSTDAATDASTIESDGGAAADGGPVGGCAGPTDWTVIASSLADEAALLPSLPETPLPVAWPTRVPALRLDRIAAAEVPDHEGAFDPACSVAPVWDEERVQVGPSLGSADGAHCRVHVASGRAPQSGLLFLNRFPVGSIHVPITGAPGWARFRFPIPPGHRAIRLRYGVAQARLFGSHPERCEARDQDEMGNCVRDRLAEGEDWSEAVPPGLFLLWGRAGDCDGWLVTGPHEPAANLSYNPTERYEVDVPESLRGVSELVVAGLVYHQYPGGCDGEVCVPAESTYQSLRIDEMVLRTEAAFEPPETPPLAHPRLWGDDATWLQDDARFSALPCRTDGDAVAGAEWGAPVNLRNLWDIHTMRPERCDGTSRPALADHAAAAAYLDGTAASSFDATRAYDVLHTVRRLRACHAAGEGPCDYSPAAVDALAARFIEIELARLDTWVWSGWPFEFDLRTLPPMRFWSIFLDTLWADLGVGEREAVRSRMSPLIDAFLANEAAEHWSLYNGNNWTPVLVEAALFWSITNWYEDLRAPEVAARALRVLWLHDGFFQEDGTYREGLLEYSRVSLESLITIHRLVERAFGRPLETMPWARLDAFASWALSFMAPDGLTVDFGDSWAKRGWSTSAILTAMLADELQDRGARVSLDPCRVRRYFTNKWFDGGFRDPLFLDPALARDWTAEVEACTEGPAVASIEASVWPSGGWGSLRQVVPGRTATAGLMEDPRIMRFEQADVSLLAVSAVPSSFPHTELDFGTLVWVTRGERLLADLGYGTINSTRRYRSAPDYPFDNNPTGHNTLVVAEAEDPAEPSTNTSQIDGIAGTVTRQLIDDVALLHLDGSAVYGRDDPERGWLDRFDRWLLPLPRGDFAVIDGFAVRADRGEATVEEYFHVFQQAETPTECTYSAPHVDLSLRAASQVSLEGRCSSLRRSAVSESAGLLTVDSLQGGSFVIDAPITYENRVGRTEYRGRARFTPDRALAWDLRAFALTAAAPGESAEMVVEVTACGEDTCVIFDGGGWRRTLRFTGAAGRYALLAITDA